MYDEHKRTLIGIDQSRITKSGVYGNLVIRTDYYVVDICRLTGVCPEGVDPQDVAHIKFDKIMALKP